MTTNINKSKSTRILGNTTQEVVQWLKEYMEANMEKCARFLFDYLGEIGKIAWDDERKIYYLDLEKYPDMK